MRKTSDINTPRIIADTIIPHSVLSQTLSQLRATSTRDSAGWKTNTEHDDEMEKLQSQNFDLVKRINDQEARLRVLEADVAALEKEVASIDEDDVESQEEMDKDA